MSGTIGTIDEYISKCEKMIKSFDEYSSNGKDVSSLEKESEELIWDIISIFEKDIPDMKSNLDSYHELIRIPGKPYVKSRNIDRYKDLKYLVITLNRHKESAKRSSQQITNNYYGSINVINGDFQNSVFVAGNEIAISYNLENVLKAVSEIESALKNEEIPSEDKETATEMIAEIREKVSQNKKPSIVKLAFIGLKDFLLGVGASLTAALIQSKIQGLF